MLPGLFFLLSYSHLSAQENSASVGISAEISAGAGTLWVEDEGASGYWHGGLDLKINLSPANHVSLDADYIQGISSLPQFNARAQGISAALGFDMPLAGFKLSGGYINHSPINAVIGEAEVLNEGGAGFFIGAQASVRLGTFALSPVFLYSRGSWKEGDMYWFFGKPALPRLCAYGLDISHDLSQLYNHSLGFRLFDSDLRIVTNDDKPIFDSAWNGGVFFYRFAAEWPKTAFRGTLGWLYADAGAGGALSTSNQPYFLFPYQFYNVEADLKANAGFAALSLRHSRGIFAYNIDLGILHFFHAFAHWDIHYKQKWLFGGNEVNEDADLDLGGIGAAFMILKASIPDIPVTQKARLSLTLQKILALPWGYSKLFPPDEDLPTSPPPSSSETNSLIKSILLSGLSVRLSIRW